jgi:murein DD-endopeptidase MepM/ murein hydrolase activator NlpD
MNRLQALFLVLLLGFVTVMWLGTGRVPPPSIVESVPSVVQPVPLITQTTQTTQITRIEKPLIVPVAGVRPDQLLDTFSDSRSEGRTHDAIDIMAPAETPVLAAADVTIQKLWLF